ncbi:LysR substrate-binding domain-containing protein [Pseudomonas sp. SZMC_28357]|uniref:LysR substrate-binding domain-containing protein n=1 Tax=Pseudomonas sp. SZMC_28357 TaxID=3074380 RepID=UPI002872816F|nr:LysR substrate-binding domain-containing protein [Pseudomonas sp. SZMC_28357]MDR9752445.1 LysR substrate-binding domain-containing protein [Pseudomonas sp. SZMC_28357]
MSREETSKKVKGYRRLIPSMTALMEFEAVARLSSFTLAAQELGVSQAAVSKQVKYLENTLGTRLFHRLHRAIKLTSDGYVLYSVVAESMQRMAGVFDKIREGIPEQELVLACTAAFSHLRILPRLATLRLSQPALHLRLVTQIVNPEVSRQDIDIAIRYGHGKWDDGTAIFLFDEEVFPVCSPAWLSTHAAPMAVDDFLHIDLIDSDSTLEGWMTWHSWFNELGESRPKMNYSLRCSSYNDTVQAAIKGHGIALGWSRLIGPLLQSGELVRVSPYAVLPKDAYYLIVPTGREVTPLVQHLVSWLQDESVGAH